MVKSHASLFGLKFWTFNLGDGRSTTIFPLSESLQESVSWVLASQGFSAYFLITMFEQMRKGMGMGEGEGDGKKWMGNDLTPMSTTF